MTEFKQLEKSDRQKVRQLLDLGIQRMYEEGLEKTEKVILQWRKAAQNPEENQKAYMKLYQTVERQDKKIARTFNGLTGSRYMITLAGLYIDGV